VSDVVYLYGIVPADAPEPPRALHGLGDAPVELVPVGNVAAVVARLPVDAYGADRIESRLDDLAWVGEQGLAHERVVLWFVDHADIIPARLFSLHPDTPALGRALESRMAAIERNLEALAGRREWNLKVAYDASELARRAAEVSDAVRSVDAEIEAAPPGRRYLLERRRAETVKRELAAAARRLADELLQALHAHAEDARVLPLAAGDTGNVVLTAALLVSRDAEPVMRADADRLAAAQQELGMIISFSGPWAPYRFMEDNVDV
jgi:hypothetical protein